MNVQKDALAETTDHRTLNLLARIKGGSLDPGQIDIRARQLLVGLMITDGYSTAEIAEMLKVSDRTVERDRRAIRQSNAVEKSEEMVEQMAGRLLSEAELCVQRIRKIVRDKITPAGVRVEGEHRCYQIISDLIQRFQGLGYLPTAATRLEAGITHSLGESCSLEEIGAELQRLKSIRKKALPSNQQSGQTLEVIEQASEAESVQRKSRKVPSRSKGVDKDE